MPKVVTADVFTPLTEFSCIISSVTTTNEGAKVGCAHDALCQFYVWGFSQPHILLSLRVIKWPMTSRGGDRLHGHPVFTYGSFLPPCSQLYNSQLTERGEGHKGEICTGHGARGRAIFSANFGKEFLSSADSTAQSNSWFSQDYDDAWAMIIEGLFLYEWLWLDTIRMQEIDLFSDLPSLNATYREERKEGSVNLVIAVCSVH